MKFLEISEGLSINIDEIEAIRKVDDFTCKVFLNFNEYTANFPYMTLLALLDTMREEKSTNQEILNKLDAVLGKAQHWAG